jgi:hypothetical protein
MGREVTVFEGQLRNYLPCKYSTVLAWLYSHLTGFNTCNLCSILKLCRNQPLHLRIRASYRWSCRALLFLCLSRCRNRLLAGGLEFDSQQVPEIVSIPLISNLNLLPPCFRIERVPGVLPPGDKRSISEADHSPPSSIEVKNDGVMHPLPHVYLEMFLINQAQLQISLKLPTLCSRDSSVGIATGYGLDGRRAGVRVLLESRIVTCPYCPQIHPASYTMRTGVKRPGRGAYNSFVTSAHANKTRVYTFTSPQVFMAKGELYIFYLPLLWRPLSLWGTDCMFLLRAT